MLKNIEVVLLLLMLTDCRTVNGMRWDAFLS